MMMLLSLAVILVLDSFFLLSFWWRLTASLLSFWQWIIVKLLVCGVLINCLPALDTVELVLCSSRVLGSFVGVSLLPFWSADVIVTVLVICGESCWNCATPIPIFCCRCCRDCESHSLLLLAFVRASWILVGFCPGLWILLGCPLLVTDEMVVLSGRFSYATSPVWCCGSFHHCKRYNTDLGSQWQHIGGHMPKVAIGGWNIPVMLVWWN